MIAKTLALLRKITFCFQFRRIWQIFMNVKAQKNHVKKFLKWLSSSQSRLNESHFVIVSVALFHSLIRTEVKDRRRRRRRKTCSQSTVCHLQCQSDFGRLSPLGVKIGGGNFLPRTQLTLHSAQLQLYNGDVHLVSSQFLATTLH